MNRKRLILSGLAVAVTAVGVLLLLDRAPDGNEKPDKTHSGRQSVVTGTKKLKGRKSGKAADATSTKSDMLDLSRPLDDFEKSLSKKDHAVYIPLSRALDDENLDDVVKYAALAVDSENEDIRQLAVEALAWFEEKAVVEMLPFLLDPSEAVATDAKRRFTDILDGMEDEDGKLKIVSSVMRKLKAGDLMDEMANRIVLTQSSEKAVKTLADLAFYGDPDVRKKAKETYREVTGEIYPGREKALEWAKANKEDSAD